MRHLKSVLAVIGAAVILVLAANTVTLAATGQAFLLGKNNSANTNTSLTRTTSGSVLKLQSKSSANAPLTVNGRGRVTNLNADKVDGYDSSVLTSNAYVYTRTIPVGTPTNAFQLNLPLPSGRYVLSYSTYMISSPSAALGDVDCYVRTLPTSGTTTYTAESRFTTTNTLSGATGSGYVSKASTNTISLKCSATNPFWVADTEPIQIVATPVTKLLANTPLPRTAVRPGR